MNNGKPLKVLFLAPYPADKAPSQRFRFEQYFEFFPDRNLEYKFMPFWSDKAWEKLYLPGHTLTKLCFLVWGFLKRVRALLMSRYFDFVFIHREATPVGPPVFEFLIHRLSPAKMIYDFDDAIWLPNTSEANRVIAFAKFHQKVKYICKWSWKISVGNEFLRQFAQAHNKNVFVNPTVVDTKNVHNQLKAHRHSSKPVIGWTGTHSTSAYLTMLEAPLSELQKEVDFDFLVISNQPPRLNLDNLIYIPWNKEQETAQLMKIDVGVMPLENSYWEQGKCGFKLIQYLSLGIPAVASPVGVNPDIVDHSANGFLAHNAGDWVKYLKLLVTDADLRNRMGQAGRRKIEDQYSAAANAGRFFSLFE